MGSIVLYHNYNIDTCYNLVGTLKINKKLRNRLTFVKIGNNILWDENIRKQKKKKKIILNIIVERNVQFLLME